MREFRNGKRSAIPQFAAISTAPAAASSSASRKFWWPIAVLLLLTLVGLGFRIYRLRSSSVDYEEYVAVAHLDAPNVLEFLHRVRTSDSMISPVPFVLAYYAYWLGGQSIVWTRLIFALLGTSMIPLIYATARRALGGGAVATHAGLIAAFCVACSPLRVLYSQEIRHTMLFSLLALASLYGLLRALQNGGRRWWAAHYVANILLLWTHLLAGMFLLVEALFLAVMLRRRLKAFAIWLATLAVWLIPWLAWVLTIPRGDPLVAPMGPGLLNMLQRLVDTDLTFLCVPRSWEWAEAQRLAPLWTLEVWPRVDNAVWWTVIVGAYLGLVCAAWRLFSGRGGTDAKAHSRREAAILLYLWLLIPPLVLVIISHLWTPIFSFRYFFSSRFALYILIGYAIACTRRKWLRRVCLTLLVAVLAYAQIIALSGPIHSDWRGVARRIYHLKQRGDVAIADEAFSDDLLRIALGRRHLAIVSATTPNAMLENAVAKTKETPPNGAWIVMNGLLQEPLTDLLDARAAADPQLELTWFRNWGERTLRTCYVARAPASAEEAARRIPIYREAIRSYPSDEHAYRNIERALSGSPAAWALQMRECVDDVPYSPLALAYFGRASIAAGQIDDALDAYQRCIAAYPAKTDPYQTLWEVATQHCSPEKQIEVWRGVVARYPKVGRPYAYLARVQAAAGQRDEAIETLTKGTVSDPQEVMVCTDLAKLLLDQGDCPAAAAHYREAIELTPQDPWLSFNLGLALASSQQFEASASAFDRACELDPQNLFFAGALVRAFVMGGQFDKAAARCQAAVLDCPDTNLWKLTYLGIALQNQTPFDTALHPFETMLPADDPIRQGRFADLPAWARDLAAAHPECKANAEQTVREFGAGLERVSRYTDAVYAYQAALAFSSDSLQDWTCLGAAFARTRDLEGALSAFKSALALQPDSQDVCQRMNESMQQLATPARCAEEWRVLAAKYPDSSWARSYLGEALRKLSDPGAAAAPALAPKDSAGCPVPANI